MGIKRKRRGERVGPHGRANQNQGPEGSEEDVAQCKRYLEEHPTMTMVQLAEVLGTSTEQLDITQELANIAVKDIFEHLQVRF